MKKIVSLMIAFLSVFAGDIKTLGEDFDSVSDIPFGWIMSSTDRKSMGIWRVESGRVCMAYPRGSKIEGFNLLFNKDLFFEKGEVRCEIEFADSQEKNGGVAFRFRDRKDYAYVYIDDLGKVEAGVVKEGKLKRLLTKKYAPRAKNLVKVRYDSSKARIFVNGEYIGDLDLSEAPKAGGAALLTAGGSKSCFDDVKIAQE